MSWYGNTSLNVNDYPEPYFKKAPQCPVCGDECEKVYIRRVDHTVVGCDQCLREEYADEAECMDE